MSKWMLSLILLLSLAAASPLAADDAIEGRSGRAEVRFLQGMIDHHQMALDMANDCLDKAQSASVIQVCQAVIEAQSAEIEQMRGWLLDWYGITYTPMSMIEMLSMMDVPQSAGHSAGGHQAHGAPPAVVTDPPMMMGMFAGFNRLKGAAYETAWLESMIDHHDDALHMAQRIQRIGQHPLLLDLAQAIIDAQTAEIAHMETLLTQTGG